MLLTTRISFLGIVIPTGLVFLRSLIKINIPPRMSSVYFINSNTMNLWRSRSVWCSSNAFTEDQTSRGTPKVLGDSDKKSTPRGHVTRIFKYGENFMTVITERSFNSAPARARVCQLNRSDVAGRWNQLFSRNSEFINESLIKNTFKRRLWNIYIILMIPSQENTRARNSVKSLY